MLGSRCRSKSGMQPAAGIHWIQTVLAQCLRKLLLAQFLRKLLLSARSVFAGSPTCAVRRPINPLFYNNVHVAGGLTVAAASALALVCSNGSSACGDYTTDA